MKAAVLARPDDNDPVGAPPGRLLWPLSAIFGHFRRLFSRPQFLHFLIRRLDACAIDISERRHYALAILERRRADISTHRRLIVLRAIRDRAERGVDLEPLECRCELVRVGRTTRLLQAVRN